ncbi:hypothetical protein [Parablautia intestinalis]
MENEDKKDFNAMLHDSKDMPKFRTITERKSIEKYGGKQDVFCPAHRLCQGNETNSMRQSDYRLENLGILCQAERR